MSTNMSGTTNGSTVKELAKRIGRKRKQFVKNNAFGPEKSAKNNSNNTTAKSANNNNNTANSNRYNNANTYTVDQNSNINKRIAMSTNMLGITNGSTAKESPKTIGRKGKQVVIIEKKVGKKKAKRGPRFGPGFRREVHVQRKKMEQAWLKHNNNANTNTVDQNNSNNTTAKSPDNNNNANIVFLNASTNVDEKRHFSKKVMDHNFKPSL